MDVHRRDPTHLAKTDAMEAAIWEVGRSRFVAAEAELEANSGKGWRRQSRRRKRSKWRLSESIWAERSGVCDAADVYDSEECRLKMFDVDWRRAIECGLGR